ncbi:MAG: hypothetical protein U1F04_12980 [Burkholderiaceae bacterium]|jgi:hypothetical protein
MFIPFLASITLGAIAAALIQLGAMSVWVSVLSMSLKAMTALAIALTLALLWAVRSAR